MIKFLIVGRTGTGKDKLRQILEQDYGWTFVLSKTTRPRRYENENTHIFITQEEADNEPSEKIAVTKIKNDNNVSYEYYATKEQLEQADAYIIDPNGIQYLLDKMPNQPFDIIYLKPADKETQKEMAIKRASDPEKAAENFQYRSEDEDPQFTQFEKAIETQTFGNNYCRSVRIFANNYQEDTIRQLAFEINNRKRFFENLIRIIGAVKDTMLNTDAETGNIFLSYRDKTTGKLHTVLETDDQFALTLSCDQTGFNLIMKQWLSLPWPVINTNTKDPEKTSNKKG